MLQFKLKFKFINVTFLCIVASLYYHPNISLKGLTQEGFPGPCFNIKTASPGMGIPMLKIRWSGDIFIPPASTKLIGGVYWYHLVRLSVCPSVRPSVRLSVCPSVCLSVCGQNRVRSVSSTILIGSISYLHILSSNLRRCVACNARFKI